MLGAYRQTAVSAPSFIAVLDSQGVLIDADSDPNEAYEKALHATPTGIVAVDAGVFAKPDPVTNPPELAGATRKALLASRIESVDYDWSNFDPQVKEGQAMVREARGRLKDYGRELYQELLDQVAGLIHKTQRRGGIALDFRDEWLTKSFLRQNQKMKKILVAGTSRSYDSIGLSLLPHGASFREPFSTSTDQGPQNTTNCLFSTPECRKVCLVNTGQRALESGAFASSYLFSHMLRDMPFEFLVNLFERCAIAFAQASSRDFGRFIRLNVLSDLPWELVAPGFFEGLADYVRTNNRWSWKQGFAFYDYTKIPYRPGVRDYYDLTLSFSGTKNLFPALFDVLEGDSASAKRAAVVFVKRENKPIKSTGSPYRLAPGKPLMVSDKRYYPWTFLGQRVWNGDLSDIRPLDPPDVKVVGLAYKVARYKVAPEAGSKKKYGLENVVDSSELDKELPTFLVRVSQPDPDAPPIVMATQDPDNRKLVLPMWQGD